MWRTTELRAKFEQAWGVKIPPKKGLHLSGMFDAMERGELKALYVIGENPANSEADQHRGIKLLSSLRHFGRAGHGDDANRGIGRRGFPGGRGMVRIRRHGHQQRAASAAGAAGAAASEGSARRYRNSLRALATVGA